ncbi:MAG: hypothetical protein ABSG42_02835 [Nitrospirota bacterium]
MKDATKHGKTARKFALVGSGIGLTLFALFGLLEGSLIGGAVGLDIVNTLLKEPAGPSLLSRMLIGASMLTGVIVSGIVFVFVFSAAGWVIGLVAELMTAPKAAAVPRGSKG